MWKYQFLNMSRDLTFVTLLKGHMALRVGASHCKSVPCLTWCPWLFCKSRNTSLRGHSNLWVGLLTVSHQPHKSWDHRNCDDKDKLCFICNVTSCEHIFKGLREFMGEAPHIESPPCHVWWPMVQCKWI